MKTTKSAKRWVYNIETGAIKRRTVTYSKNSMEAWYSDRKLNTYDPLNVDKDKDVLIARMQGTLATELQETLNEAEKIMERMRKLNRGG